MIVWQLAQLNIAKMKYPIDSPEMGDFVGNLDQINSLAEAADGFVWRLQTDDGDATQIRHFGNDTIVNMSVWRDLEALHYYVYKTAHAKIMSRRKEWFGRLDAAYSVLWWTPSDHMPTIEEADHKLLQLRASGPTADAFTMKAPFVKPDEPE